MQQLRKVKNSLNLFFFLFFCTINAQTDNQKINVNSFLNLGPVDVFTSQSMEDGNARKELKNLLQYESLPAIGKNPAKGDSYEIFKGKTLNWKVKDTENNKVVLSNDELQNPKLNYLTFYVDNERYMEIDLKIKSTQMFSVYFEGKNVDKKDSFEEPNEKGEVFPGFITTKLKLETGKHTVMIKTLSSPEMNNEWYIESWLEVDPKFAESIKITTDPVGYVDFDELLNHIKATDVAISPDGNIAAITLTKRDLAEDKQNTWIELYDTKAGTLLQTFKGGMNLSALAWAPLGNMFAYKTSNSLGGSIWIYDLSTGVNKELLKDQKDLGGFEWAPDASYLIYTTYTSPEKPDKNFKKYRRIEDRWSYGRDYTNLYQVFLPNGTKRELTTGTLSKSFVDIHPNSKELLFTIETTDPTEWPFSKTTYYSMNLTNLKVDSLFTMIFSNGASYSPDGNKLLILGAPSSFNGAGKNVPEGVFPNDYDGQAYIYDLKSGKAKAISKEFNPAIGGGEWIAASNSIYFETTDKSFSHLYRYDVNSGSYSLLELGGEYLSSISFAENGSTAVYFCESNNVPRKVFTLDLSNEEYQLLLDPDKSSFDKIKLGETKEFTFTSSAGQEIMGRINLPPNFNPAKKYPLIVNYYGGTSPVERSFEGRYPTNIWAANGYVVYVLQPSGATGFGQEFSAKHVNDWGKTTGEEIIEGTKAVLAEYDFLDPQRVGCIGASYGGFMTQDILTKTDIYAAAISHAGISTLTSYWGEGYWGYIYSAVATANSYPWNRKDIYVDQSPIYNADKITTPMLLLHGNADNNVPRGDTWTMYQALKLLGQDVEFVEVDNIGHLVMEYHRRNKWSRTILAYFDKYLKGQPEWWNDLYK